MTNYKSYDELFSEILTAYQNAAPDAPVSAGSELYMRAAGLASAVWGLLRENRWVLDQIFPTTASPEGLLRHGQDLGIEKRDGESWESYLERILAIYQTPSGGGNKTDYERWAMSVKVLVGGVEESADAATCFPAKFGPGTVVLLIERTGATPSQTLLDAIREYVLEVGPVAPAEVYVYRPSTRSFSLSIQMAGGDRAKAASLIQTYLATLLPGQILYPEAIKGLCYQAGASQAFPTPSTPQIPGPFERLVLSGEIAWL